MCAATQALAMRRIAGPRLAAIDSAFREITGSRIGDADHAQRTAEQGWFAMLTPPLVILLALA
jgi:hypothetical protein